MFTDVDFLIYVVFETITKVPKSSSFFLNNIGLMWNRKIMVCSSMARSVYVTSEYRTIAHSDGRFDQATTL